MSGGCELDNDII